MFWFFGHKAKNKVFWPCRILAPNQGSNAAVSWRCLLNELEIWLGHFLVMFSSVQSLSRVQLCNPMDCTMPGFPVHHQLLDFAQTHVYQVSDAVQPSHPLSSPSPALNLCQHQGLFQWVSSSHQVPRVLELQLQHQFFQWIIRVDWFPLGLTGLISLQSKGLSRVFSSTAIWRHQFIIHPSLWSNSHIHTWLLEKP